MYPINESPSRISQRPRIFEEFFIIGVDRTDLESVGGITVNRKNDWDRHYLQPKTLYMYNGEDGDNCERRRVVKDFCFPDGIEVKQLKKAGESKQGIVDKAQKILYSQKSVREQCFVFTMNANDEVISESSMYMQPQSSQ